MTHRANPRSCLSTSILLSLMLFTSGMAKTIYVDADAAGANDGSSWQNAYVHLQEALAAANLSPKPVEVRVAQGVYRPNQGLVAIPEFDWRTTTFQLVSGVALKGGYAGLGQPDPNARDVELYETVLSGDLNGDDVDVADSRYLLIEPSRAENSYHVVTGSATGATAVLDGFTVTAGNADKGAPSSSGGGMFNHAGSPTIENCIFRTNSANLGGGGMYNYENRPSLTNCIFSNNAAYYEGGGMENCFNASPVLSRCMFSGNSARSGAAVYNLSDCDPILTDCIFSRNLAGNDGGGIFNEENCNPSIINCTFNENAAYDGKGGGICNLNLCSPTISDCTFNKNLANTGGGLSTTFKSNPILTNCTFIGNRANGGGGMANSWNSSPTLANCIFSGNVAVYEGGGMYNSESSATLTNCTFVGNSGPYSGGMYNSFDASATLTNCILWNNTLPQVTANVVMLYSDVQGGYQGEGNIDADPLFASPGFWADANDPNIVVEPTHPNAVWIEGDYHLRSQAGRWEPNSQSWVLDDVTSPCIDAGDPNSPVGDEPEPNGGRVNMGAYGGTAEASKSPSIPSPIVYIQWLGHSSVKVWAEDCIVYVDPQRLSISPHDATLVLVTHTHGDHYSPTDIARVSNNETKFVAPPDVVRQYGKGENIAPGQTIESYCARLTGVASYNTNKTNHPKSNNWVGYIIELGGKRIYVAGDTDLIEEMKSLGNIDVAILPAGGTYTMNAVEAAQATQYIKPDLAIPYHWGQNVGTIADAQTFAQLARCAVKIMTAGETISSDNWPVYSPLIANWKLDETAGGLAQDSAGDYDGTLHGGPVWLPAGGKKAGALQLDGADDYVGTPFVSNPADGAFSAFTWVRGGAPGQVIVSQAEGTGTGEIWMGADTLHGKLMTGLIPPPSGRTATPALKSDFIITDGQWHHVGFVWDGSRRHLYADGVEAAKDAAAVASLKSAAGGLNLGAGKSLEAGTFWLGLLDDVRIYNRALDAAEVAELAQ